VIRVGGVKRPDPAIRASDFHLSFASARRRSVESFACVDRIRPALSNLGWLMPSKDRRPSSGATARIGIAGEGSGELNSTL